MRFVVTFVSLVVLSGCLARPNPRVSKIVKEPANDDDPSEELTFGYDDNGRIADVKKTEGDIVRAWQLTWESGQLTKVAIENDEDGARVSEASVELSYEGGKLVSGATVRDDDATASTFSYDGQGRLVKLAVNGEDEEATTEFEYGDDGQLATMSNDATREGITTKGTLELQRSDGLLESMTLANDGQDPQRFELTFDDAKRLAQISFVTEAELGGDVTGVDGFIDFAYDDDGRVERAQHTGKVGEIQVDVATTEVEYEDGDASSLDMSANQVMLFGFFFDMKGAHYGTFDNTTTVPRLAFTSW